MFEYDNDISTSGPVSSQSYHVSEGFTQFNELPSKGYCRLVKAQRYGVWNVLKGLKPQYADDEQYREMISKEFSLMVGLNHPNIVRTYGLEQIPEWGTCIVMEFVDGRTLSDFLSEKPATEQRRKVVDELLDALAYFHKKQIVHQDLKPSNILITNDGNHVKIIDFGLSDSRDYAILKEPAYTKAYAAPEQLSGGEIDNRTDLYAFGLILQQIFPKRYNGIAKKCLQPQREKRYTTAEAIALAIRRADRTRKSLPITLGTLLLLSSLAVFSFYFFNNQHNEKVENVVKERVVMLKPTKEDDLSAEKNEKTDIQTEVKNAMTNIQNDIAAESAAQEMVDQYIYNLKFEFDSIIRPFDKEVKSGNILYCDFYIIRLQIALEKMSIHIQKQRQQLPKNKQTAYLQYAGDLWNRYYAKRPYTDDNGNNKYPYYNDLYREGKISEKEFNRLSEAYDKDAEELRKLSAQLREETAKD